MASKHAVLGLTKTAAVDLESLLFAMKVEGGQLNVSRIGRSLRRIRMVCFMAAIRFNGYHRGHEGDTEVTLSKFPWDERYRVSDIDNVLTPALVVYPEIIESNIAWTLHLLGGDADRWRAHIKTAKLAYPLRMLVERGVRNLKCATTLELLRACRSGAADVLLAYPAVGANAAACAK